MRLEDWVDVKALRTIAKHTSGCAGALLSFILISRLAEWGIGPGFFRFVLEYVDKMVLVVIFLYFLWTVGYDLYREIKRSAGGS